MTGAFVGLTRLQKIRIVTFTGEGLSSSVIAERLNLRRSQVYRYQVGAGLREQKKRNKEKGGSAMDKAKGNKEYFYYLRDEQRKPVVTVCLIIANNYVSRGVAICSDMDCPCKKTGRAIARGMATRAFVRKGSGDFVVRDEAFAVLRKIPTLLQQELLLGNGKYVYMPVLTDFETKLLTENDDHPFRIKDVSYLGERNVTRE